SSTLAVTVTLPPFGPTLVGEALTAIVLTAATPTVIVTTLVAVDVVVVVPVPPLVDPDPPPAPPDTAWIVATPGLAPALNVATATPLLVCASAGVMVPRVVVKRTIVPFCTGVPLDSVTKAVSPTVPLVGTVDEFALSVIAEPVGAISGTLSHAAISIASTMASVEMCAVRFVISSSPNN